MRSLRRPVSRLAAYVVLFAFLGACTSGQERTWATEIQVCAEATRDVAGCQWLAGILIHRECRLESYQTFAAALTVGGTFENLYLDAVERGVCGDPDGATQR